MFRSDYIKITGATQSASILLAILPVIIYILWGSGENIDGGTVVSNIILTATTYIIVSKKVYGGNNFVIISSIFALSFYSTRVTTLLIFPDHTSHALQRMRDVGPDDLTFTLLYVSFCLLCIYAGTNVGQEIVRKHKTSIRGAHNIQSFRPLSVIITLYIFIIKEIVIFLVVRGSPDQYTFLKLFDTITHYYLYIILVFVYVIIHRESLDKTHYLLIIFGCALFVAMRIFQGSRSGAMVLVLAYFLAQLSVSGKVYISFNIIILGIVSIVFTFIMFPVATFARQFIYSVDSASNIQFYNIYTSVVSRDYSNYDFLISTTDRLGFLDYTSNLIVNASTYKEVINPLYYVKSIINRLTPFMDVFGNKFASQHLKSIYSTIDYQYHSDLFTVFGEYYVMFGLVGGGVAIYLCALLFTLVYSRNYSSKVTTNIWIKALVLLFFFVFWLYSFGMDWAFVHFIYNTIGSIIIYITLNLVDSMCTVTVG